MPGLALQVVPGVRGHQTSLGAGAGRADRSGDFAGGRSLAHRRAKSAVYKPEFGNFADIRTAFLEKGGQKGVQRPVLSPGTLAPIHPLAFMVITRGEVFGVPMSSDLRALARSRGRLTHEAFGLSDSQLEVTRHLLRGQTEGGKVVDMVGRLSRHLEGQPLPSAGDIASRLELAGSRTSRRWKPRMPTTQPTPGSSKLFWATRTIVTTPIRTFRNSWIWADGLDFSTIRCSTALTT